MKHSERIVYFVRWTRGVTRRQQTSNHPVEFRSTSQWQVKDSLRQFLWTFGILKFVGRHITVIKSLRILESFFSYPDIIPSLFRRILLYLFTPTTFPPNRWKCDLKFVRPNVEVENVKRENRISVKCKKNYSMWRGRIFSTRVLMRSLLFAIDCDLLNRLDKIKV